MKAIWKYKITNGYLTVTVPKGTKTLCCKMQENVPCVWIEVNLDEKKKERKLFKLIATGEEFCGPMNYVSTIQNNCIVFHLYETTIYYKKEENE